MREPDARRRYGAKGLPGIQIEDLLRNAKASSRSSPGGYRRGDDIPEIKSELVLELARAGEDRLVLTP
jgi:hypothetical protein